LLILKGDAMHKCLVLALAVTGFPASAQFGPGSVIDHGNYHSDLIAADLDGDTDLDLFYRQGPGSYLCAMNVDGLGQFAPPSTMEMGEDPWNRMRNAVGDLDGDLDLDLILLRPWSNELVWLANDGSGNFGTAQLITSTAAFPEVNIACADVGGSALPDVLVSDGGTVRWWVNSGGTFSTMDSLVHGEEHWSRIFRVVDIDLDGDMDHVVISDSVHIGLNEGGSWSSITWHGVDPSNYWYGQELIDVDADGDLDFVEAGTGVFWAESQMADNGTLGSLVHWITEDDALNEGAGWSASLGCGTGASILWCQWGYTSPIRWAHFDAVSDAFTAPALTSRLSPAGDGCLFFGDLNGDGRKDIIISHQDTLKWYPNEMAATGGSAATVPPLDTICMADPYPLPDGAPAGGLWSGIDFTWVNVLPAYAFGLQAGTFELHYGAVDSAGCIASAVAPIVVEDCLSTGVEEPDGPQAMLWPNPAEGVVHLSFAGGATDVLVFDAMGRKVIHQGSATSPVVLRTGSLVPGIYHVWAGQRSIGSLMIR
jgi:hypothetical protein